MKSALLIKQLEACYRTIGRNVEGITQEESLVAPQPSGNSLNWVVGHIVASRNGLHRVAGLDMPWSKEEARPYIRGSAPLEVGSARRIEDLLQRLNQSQHTLLERLQQMSDADFDETLNDSTRGEQLAFLLFHESYHVGQLGLLRRLLGKEGAIT